MADRTWTGATAACLRSRACQITGVALAFLLVAARHWASDGFWFGDAPQHAINGMFWWEYLAALPADPTTFALSYYARYPIINPVKYPPLFYLLEGSAFAVFGASPHVAKALVLMFGIMAGLYTMAWARRWIAPGAGWAGAFLPFAPGFVLLTQAVMLNVPATALGLGALFHLRRWLDAGDTRQLLLAVLFVVAVLLTYYPGAAVLAIGAAWVLMRSREVRVTRRVLVTAAVALCAFVPVVLSIALGPVHASRHFPSLEFLSRGTTWTFYWRMLPAVVGAPLLVLGSAGLVLGWARATSRRESLHLTVWIAGLLLAVSLLPARDQRYILLTVPAFALAAAVGCAQLLHRTPTHAAARGAALAAALGGGYWLAARVPVPAMSGLQELAAYLREEAPADAILYEGGSEGIFGFYLAASDPHFERRLVRADKTVYEQGATTSFEKWMSRSYVTSTDDVLTLLRTRAGTRWVAVEAGRGSDAKGGQRLLLDTLARPELELVRSFPFRGSQRIDLYRLSGPVEMVKTVDLRFPSFTSREFLGVVPITR